MKLCVALGGVKQASHLLKYDSTLGKFDADVKSVSPHKILLSISAVFWRKSSGVNLGIKSSRKDLRMRAHMSSLKITFAASKVRNLPFLSSL